MGFVALTLVHPAEVVGCLALRSGAGGTWTADDAGPRPVGRSLRDSGLRRQDQAVGDDAVEQRDEEHDHEGELDHFRAAFIVLPTVAAPASSTCAAPRRIPFLRISCDRTNF